MLARPSQFLQTSHDEHHIGYRARRPATTLFLRMNLFPRRCRPNPLVSILRLPLPACATRERPLWLPHSVNAMIVVMFSNFSAISPVIHPASMIPWNVSKISWELLESPSLNSSVGSSSGPKCHWPYFSALISSRPREENLGV